MARTTAQLNGVLQPFSVPPCQVEASYYPSLVSELVCFYFVGNLQNGKWKGAPEKQYGFRDALQYGFHGPEKMSNST